MLTHGFMYGFNTGLFAQLRKTKEIQLDLELESWLASSTNLSFIVGTLFSSIFMDRFGRRPAFIIASATMIIGWLIFIAAKSFTALLVAKIFQGFSAGVETAGSASLPNIVAGEIFPLANRSACGVVCNIMASLYTFINIKNIPYIFSKVGVSGVFFMNAALLSYALVITMYMLPETKDKTLLEIEIILRGCPIADDDETMINLKKHNETNF
ncbi:uncharacterized protein LOC110385169 [Bombyx mori]|uniref:Major facilitator superfamily (MFS) profile domain-containing protein n=1 Tax=Bombyx mori TaxID=7091 RepID=A0A8R2DLC7_BOMMO|nr:sugar transporter ERD6-like 15 [Bombyx mori]